MMRVIGQRIPLYTIVFALLALPTWAFAGSSSVEDFTAIVNTGTIKQTTSGSGNRQDLNVGSANATNANSFNATVTTGSITQSSSGTGIVQRANIGSANNAKVDSFTATVNTGKIEQISNRSGDRQELDIGSVNNSTVNGAFKSNVKVKEGVKQTGSGEIVLGSVKNSNVQDFSTTLEVKGKVTGNNIRIGSIVGGERFDSEGKNRGQALSTDNVSNGASGSIICAENDYELTSYRERMLRYARLSNAVYGEEEAAKIMAKPELKDVIPLGLSESHNFIDWKGYENGFKATAYYDKKNNEVIISYAGTDSLMDAGDMIANAGVLVGFSVSKQWEQSLNFYNKVMNDTEVLKLLNGNNPPTIMIAGHSLGGGLAQYVGAIKGKEAVAFNPAAVPLNKAFGLPKNNSNIHIIKSTFDVVFLSDAYLSRHLTEDIKNVNGASWHPIDGLLAGMESTIKSGCQGS